MIFNKTGYLMDLDGTVYCGKEPIQGAKEWIEKLIQTNQPFMLVTNNSMRSHQEVADHLAAVSDIQVPLERIYTSIDALLYVLQGDFPKGGEGKACYCIGSPAVKEDLQNFGFQLKEDLKENLEVVVVGLNQDITYYDLATATLAVQKGAKFYLTNPDVQFPSVEGFVPGAGALGEMIGQVARQKPVVCGKPSRVIMEGALNVLNLRADQCVMIGDNLQTDILAANNAQITALLIETGVNTRQDVQEGRGQPDYVVKDYEELMQLWQED